MEIKKKMIKTCENCGVQWNDNTFPRCNSCSKKRIGEHWSHNKKYKIIGDQFRDASKKKQHNPSGQFVGSKIISDRKLSEFK